MHSFGIIIIAALGDRDVGTPFMESAAYHGFATPFPVFLPAVGSSRAAKVQVVDALFDHEHGRRVAFIVKDPKPYKVMRHDRFGHGNRSWNYAIPIDATCLFETDAMLGGTPQKVRNVLSSGLAFGFTDLRYYSSGDVWLCDVPAMLQEHAVLRLRLDLGNSGAYRLTPTTWVQKTRYLDIYNYSATEATRSDLCKTPRVAPTVCTKHQARHHRHLFIAISALPCQCRSHGRSFHCACFDHRLVANTPLRELSVWARPGYPPCSYHIHPSEC